LAGRRILHFAPTSIQDAAAEVRTRTNDRSFFNFGFYGVKDRIFGPDEDAEHPDQGGTLFYADGVQYFSNGWTAAADVRVTSNLDFRQVFSDGVQQIISPIEVSQGFANKSWTNYTLDLLARTQVISIPNVSISTRNIPSVHFEKRPSVLSFLNGVYFSFKTSAEGVSRRETATDLSLYRAQTDGSDPVRTPLFVKRFDGHPQVTVPINTKYVNFTLTGGMGFTFYSDSFNDMRRVVGRDVLRQYGEFEFDIRPVAFAKNFYGKGDEFKFRHVIEPFVTYRYIKGIDNFARIIRFDELDTLADTNEIEFGVTNRFYTRRYAEAVTDEARRQLSARSVTREIQLAATGEEDPSGHVNARPRQLERSDDVSSVDAILAGAARRQKDDLSIQPYEVFSLTIRGKYFFDKTFGGALVPGRRNQIAPITALTFYTFGGVARNFSPLNIDMTYRPQRTIFFNTRMDVGVQGDALRAASATVGYDTPMLKIFQTFYYTRAVDLIPSLASQLGPQPNTQVVKEPGTIRGSQWSPSVFIGNRDKGLYGGASVFFDFENRRATRLSPLISSLYTLGYAYDCCAIAAQFYTFNVGARNENSFLFSFRLKGIGAFGTEQFAQGLR
jgi:LPS-assembly protein